MSIITGVKTFLAADTDVTAAVVGRIYRDRAPQDEAQPYIILQRISTARNYHLENESALAETTVQVDLYVDIPNKVDTVGEHIRNRMSGYRGAMGTETIRSCVCERDSAAATKPVDGSDEWQFRRSFDFQISHTVTVPSHA